MRALVVEDEAKMAALIRRGLAEEGYSADVARTGEEALWMARATPYDAIVLDLMLPGRARWRRTALPGPSKAPPRPSDAIVLDLMLPGRDGLEVYRELRESGVWSPILMLTARDGVEDRVEGLDSGADDYLSKPF